LLTGSLLLVSERSMSVALAARAAFMVWLRLRGRRPTESSVTGLPVKLDTCNRAQMSKPRFFVGSSIEQLAVARAIAPNLRHEADVQVWARACSASAPRLSKLGEGAARNSIFAALVLAADDVIRSCGNEQTPRDKVLTVSD
jgi:predicted nucleotide-binding protein